jgi:hypothetical protein
MLRYNGHPALKAQDSLTWLILISRLEMLLISALLAVLPVRSVLTAASDQ